MVSIFVSHAWSESRVYENFAALLDNELGKDSWINLSIPRSQALDLRGPSHLEGELDRLEDELVRVQAALSRPGVPDALVRVVWDAEGNRREEETVGSLREKKGRLLRQIADLGALLPSEYVRPPEFNNRKNAAEQLRLHPELSLAIRRRINKADFVFVLVTPFCRFRRWVDYEIAVCAGVSSIVVAVLSGGEASPDFYLDCHKVIPWGPEEVRRVIAEA